MWAGNAGTWALQLTVKGNKGALTLSCGSNDFLADVPVSADGTIDAYNSTGGMRRQIKGKLPTIDWPAGGICQGGTATMVKR